MHHRQATDPGQLAKGTMIMSLQWDKSLELGVEEIDAQHRSIFGHFAKISDASLHGDAEDILKELTFFLYDCAPVHTATEDRIMVDYGYPDIEIQRSEHAKITKFAIRLKQRIEQGEASRELVIEETGELKGHLTYFSDFILV